ncbi:MAG: SGNH/GDSL hydrolase family protein [Gammaproteobacteria bacterium]
MTMMRPDVVPWGNVGTEEHESDPNDSLYDNRILAEGDSWFSMGGIPTSNLLFSMRFKRFTIIVNCARPGDTIRKIGAIARNSNLKKAMSRKDGYAWDVILLSGGGNDLIDDIDNIVMKFTGIESDPANYCNQVELAKTLQSVEKGYRKIIDLRDAAGSSCKGKPVVTHTYDWMTPRNSPARFFPFKIKGPWIYPVLVTAGVPESQWNIISDYLVDSLRTTIKGLTTGPDKLPNFHVVSTQDTITPAALGETGESGGWMNEIHPGSDGYKKLATKISKRVRRFL